MAKKFLDYDGLEEVVAQIKAGYQPTITLTGSKAVQTNSSGKLESSSVTNTELGYLSGVTSAIQTQLNAKQAALTAGNNITIETINNLLTISAQPGVPEITQATNMWELSDGLYKGNLSNFYYKTNQTISIDNTTAVIIITRNNQYIYFYAIYDAGLMNGTTSANNGSLYGGYTFSELLKQSDVVNNLTSTSTSKPLSAAQGKALNESKQDTITGGASSITSSNLTASRALVSDSNGKVAASDVTSTEIGYLDGVTSAIQTQLNGKQATLTTAQQTAVDSGITGTLVGKISTNESAISTINEKIPSQASSTNQLADKDFVNSSIQTQTAHFRGNWDTWSQVPTQATSYPADDDGNKTPTSNDYMVVQDASGYPVGTGEDALAGTWRFKYSGVWATNGKAGWLPEYQVNETPLTAAQIAAINSGITSTLVGQITTNQTNIGNKVDKSSTVSQVYITDASGASTTASQSTAFNKAFETSTSNIKMNGSVSVGSSNNIARADHIHPSDTSRLPTYATDGTSWDTAPTANSTKPVTSGGIKTALDGKEDTMTAITTTEIDELFNPSSSS